MKFKTTLAATIVLLLTACGERASTAASQVAATAPSHRYEVNDGMEYGYSASISQDAKNGGQVAPKILMFKYAGQRDGKHQVHSSDGVNFTAIECASPCEVMKIMNFIDKDYLRDAVHVERIRNQAGSVAHAVMEDALNGRLHNYGIGRGKQTFQAWVDERQGYQKYAVKTTDTDKSGTKDAKR